MHRANEIPEEWYVIFTDAKYDHWCWRFVDRSMGHVYAVKDLNDYQWLVIQPRINIVQTKILLKCQYPVIGAIAAKEDKVLKVKTFPGLEPIGMLNWSTCVEQVKGLLGIKSFWTITPKQLYRGLLENRYG